MRRIDELSEDAVAVTFAVPAALQTEFRFVPGQHVGLGVDAVAGGVRRFSVAPPASPDELRVVVRASGAFGDHVRHALAPGDVVEATAPSGRLLPQLDPGRARTYVAVAAGTGVVPAYAVAAEALAVEAYSTFTLFCVNRTAASSLLGNELAALSRRYPARLEVHHALSREEAPGTALRGGFDGVRLWTIMARSVAAADVDEWILCGPPAMVAELASVLAEQGVPALRIHHQVVAPTRPPPDRFRPVTRRWAR